jgi:hypothetical protein
MSISQVSAVELAIDGQTCAVAGNNYVGAIRMCLSGLSAVRNQSHSTVKELDFCQLLANADQTMPQHTHLRVDLTRVVNRTEGLRANDPTVYSGIWIPNLTVKSLNDRIAYAQLGAYLRYLSSQQYVTIDLSETPFFLKNTQEPIAKSGEILFHNILFSTVCIELFALAFLLFKLIFLPVLQVMHKYIQRQWRDRHDLMGKF